MPLLLSLSWAAGDFGPGERPRGNVDGGSAVDTSGLLRDCCLPVLSAVALGSRRPWTPAILSPASEVSTVGRGPPLPGPQGQNLRQASP